MHNRKTFRCNFFAISKILNLELLPYDAHVTYMPKQMSLSVDWIVDYIIYVLLSFYIINDVIVLILNMDRVNRILCK